MQLTIWDKKIQRLLAANQEDSTLLACALLGEEVWMSWLWIYMSINGFECEKRMKVFHLPHQLRISHQPIFKHYKISSLASASKKRWRCTDTGEVRGYVPYLEKMYQLYKSRK